MIKDRIRYVRKDAKLTQTEFGKKIGVSLSAIQNLEYGRVEPNDLTILMLCRTFHVNEHWLRTGDGEMYREQSRGDMLVDIAGNILGDDMSDDFEAIVLALKKVSPERLAAFCDFCESVAEERRNIIARKENKKKDTPE